MPHLTTVVFKQRAEFKSLPTDQTSTVNSQSKASTQESTSIQITPQQDENHENAEKEIVSPSYTFIKSICKNKKEPLNRLVTFFIHGVKYLWDVDVVLKDKRHFYTYTITRESHSYIHSPIKSDLLLKYKKLTIPISIESQITEARLAQEACVVSALGLEYFIDSCGI